MSPVRHLGLHTAAGPGAGRSGGPGHGAVGNIEQVRSARNGPANLTIGSGAALILKGNLIPNSDLSVGDNFSGFGGALCGIGNFGSPALGATLTTSGNLSIGRQGTGSVALTRNANLSANQINMSVIDGQGISSLVVGFQSTVNTAVVNAGIGYNAMGLGDRTVAAHGTAGVVVRDASSTLNSTLLLGTGGRPVFTALNRGISVPEPMTLVLLVTALLAGAAGSSRRRVTRTPALH